MNRSIPTRPRQPNRLRAALLVTGVLAPSVGGCGAEAGTPETAPGTTFATSGDTTFATTTGVGDRAGWRAQLVEELTIGALEGSDEVMFGQISSVAAHPDGGVYVYDSQASEIRRFDANGDFVRRVGREGEGPGEYQEVNEMVVLADGRLIINDPRNGRISWYDSAGVIEHSVPAWSRLFGARGTGLTASPDGESVWVKGRVTPSGAPPGERVEAFLRHGRDGSVDTLLVPDFDVDRFTTVVRHPEAGISLQLRTPFAPTGVWMVGPAGDYRARSDRYRLDLLEPDGSVRRIEADPDPVPVTEPEREYQYDRSLASARRLDPSWSWSLPDVPDSKPFLKTIYVGGEGRIWLHVSTPAEPYEVETDDGLETRWREPILFDVFEPDGTYLGAVDPPPDHSLAAFRRDTVWALYRDELDVPYLKRFRVVFPEPPGGS